MPKKASLLCLDLIHEGFSSAEFHQNTLTNTLGYPWSFLHPLTNSTLDTSILFSTGFLKVVLSFCKPEENVPVTAKLRK